LIKQQYNTNKIKKTISFFYGWQYKLLLPQRMRKGADALRKILTTDFAVSGGIAKIRLLAS
jgi:hypothetical protein